MNELPSMFNLLIKFVSVLKCVFFHIVLKNKITMKVDVKKLFTCYGYEIMVCIKIMLIIHILGDTHYL